MRWPLRLVARPFLRGQRSVVSRMLILVLADREHRFAKEMMALAPTLPGCECLFGNQLADFPAKRLPEVDVLVSAIFAGGQVRAIEELWPKLSNAKWIHSLSAGVDTLMPVLQRIPSTEAIPVTNAKGAFSRSLAEYAICAMLHFCKQIPRLQAAKQVK